VDGLLVETYSDRAASVESVTRTLERGSVTMAEPTVVHGLRNRSGADATTLHVYSPPIVDVTFFDLHPAGSCDAVRSTPVIGRPAQATSEGVASMSLPPVTLLRP